MSAVSFLAASSVLVLALGACHRPSAAEQDAVSVPTQRATVSRPVDQALPGELAEGSEKAFALVLPRGARIVARFEDLVIATIQVSPDQLEAYVKERVVAGRVDRVFAKVTFVRTTIKSDPGPLYAIQLTPRDGLMEVTVRNTTPPKVKEGLSPAERWRELGYDPSGRQLDPTHLE